MTRCDTACANLLSFTLILLRTRTQEGGGSDPDPDKGLTLFLSEGREWHWLKDKGYQCTWLLQGAMMLKEEEGTNVDNDEDCDGDHLAVSYRRQHRLLASYLEMVQQAERPPVQLECCMERTHGANLSPNTDGALWELLLLIN